MIQRRRCRQEQQLFPVDTGHFLRQSLEGPVRRSDTVSEEHPMVRKVLIVATLLTVASPLASGGIGSTAGSVCC